MACVNLPEPAEHVPSVAAMATVVTPGEPVVELSQFVLPCQVDLVVGLSRACQKTQNTHHRVNIELMAHDC